VVYFAALLAIAIVAALWLASSRRDSLGGARLAAVAILALPVAGIGFYEGGYNHVLKNLVYFAFGRAQAVAIFPAPTYEMPNDLFFELTGVAQFPLSIMTAIRTLALLREARRMRRSADESPGRRSARRLRTGDFIVARQTHAISGDLVHIPDGARAVHLQFRRFAGCPVCNLHLRSFVRAHHEIVAAGVREVAVFHSSIEDLRPYVRDFPFAVIADPEKQLYAEFGVESSAWALLDPRAWLAIVAGIVHSLVAAGRNKQPIPSLNPAGGRFGLPADFLIGPDGRVLAHKYGMNADDQWSVADLLALAKRTH
jgi:peroxiredoxin